MGARPLAVVGAVLVGCAGPDPRIERVAIVAPQLAGHVRVDLMVVNRSRGHGQVQIEIRLQRTSDPRSLAADRTLELDGHQQLELTVDIPAPDGDYVAQARAFYPD